MINLTVIEKVIKKKYFKETNFKLRKTINVECLQSDEGEKSFPSDQHKM